MRPHSYRVLAGLAAIAIAAVTTLIVAPTAAAGNDLGRRVDGGSNITLTRYELTTRFSNAAEWVRVNTMNPTDLSVSIFSDTTIRDITMHDANYGTQWFGRYYCNRFASGSTVNCVDSRVQINLSLNPPDGSYSDTDARSLSCEELGHAVGLAHDLASTTSCMSQDWNRTYWSGHDQVDQINRWY